MIERLTFYPHVLMVSCGYSQGSFVKFTAHYILGNEFFLKDGRPVKYIYTIFPV